MNLPVTPVMVTSANQNLPSSGVTWTSVNTVGGGGSGGIGQTVYELATYLVIVFPFGISHSTAASQIYDKGEMYIVDATSRSEALAKVRDHVGNRPMFIMEGTV